MASTAPAPGPSSGWHQQDIQAAIRKRGLTLAELSRRAGLSGGTLQSIFYQRYPKGQKLVSDFLGVPLHVLWPHWYGPKDELRRLGGGRIYRRAGK